MHPIPELPGSVELLGAGEALKLQMLDISLGGVGLWIQRGSLGAEVGARISLALDLGGKKVQVDAIVRHASPDGSLHGVEFVEVSDENRTIINGYVTELTERGASV